jgi:hypothetical protein
MCMIVYVHMYLCVYVRFVPFVFITIHAQLVIKKCSMKTHSYFSTLQSERYLGLLVGFGGR